MTLCLFSQKYFFCIRQYPGKILILVTTLCLASVSALPPSLDAKTVSPQEKPKVMALTLEEAGEKFQSMRVLKGHFNGGTWNHLVDPWMGSKHKLMIHIARLISSRPTTEPELLSLLGPPDDRLHSGDYFSRLISSLPDHHDFTRGGCSLLVYQWRGNHDVLFFVSQSGSIIKTGWWHAGE